jgi:hypothetical protein
MTDEDGGVPVTLTGREKVVNIARAVIKMIPHVGEGLDQLIFGVRDELQMKRMEQALQDIRTKRVPTLADIPTPDLPLVKVESQAPTDSVYGVVERFKQVFTSHGITLTQIPRFIDSRFGMSLADLRSDDALLLKLNDELLYWIGDTFNVRRRWIDGDDEYIYATPDYYKCVSKFIDFFVDLLARGYKPEVYAFKSTKELSTDVQLYSRVALLISIKIGAIDGKLVQRYYPIRTDWLWHHWRSRYEFKAIVYLLGLLSVYIRSFDLEPNLLGLLQAGWIFPEPVLHAPKIWYTPYTWYPDDYVETEGGGARREIEEADEIIKFVHDEGYFERLQQRIQENDLCYRYWRVMNTFGNYPNPQTNPNV